VSDVDTQAAADSPWRAWLFRLRGSLTAIPVVAALVLPYGYAPPTPLTWALGGVLLVGAGALRFWSRRYIGRSSDTSKRKVTAFVCGGPYARVRNPLYIANIAAATGACLWLGNAWLAGLTLVVASIEYNVIVRDEEKLLLTAYPDAERYVNTISRWIPIPGRRYAPESEPRFEWNEVFRREGKRAAFWGALFLVLAVGKTWIMPR
jgi:protein-S-isoprenylcysteine O-methyltransferase Ste14